MHIEENVMSIGRISMSKRDKELLDLYPSLDIVEPVRTAFHVCRQPHVKRICIKGGHGSGKTTLAMLLTVDAMLCLSRHEDPFYTFRLDEPRRFAVVAPRRELAARIIEQHAMVLETFTDRRPEPFGPKPRPLLGARFVHVVIDNCGPWYEVPGIDDHLVRRTLALTDQVYPARGITTVLTERSSQLQITAEGMHVDVQLPG